MCSCTALNLNCTLITSRWKQSTRADQSHVHESKDGSCEYSHTSFKSNAYLESKTLLIRCQASKSLSAVERRYSQTEKEALAVVWAYERFHVFLYGIEFELYTDHKPLETIYSSRSKPCARIERWILRIQPYKFQVKCLP